MIVSGYYLHLYCDTGNKKPDTAKSAPVGEAHDYLNGGFNAFTGCNEADAKREAKAAGWTFNPGGFVYCPRCSRNPGQRPTSTKGTNK